MDRIFCDGIRNAALVDNTVRIEFFALSPDRRDGQGRASEEIHLQVVLPLRGFLATVGTLEGLMRQMADKNIIRRDRPGGGPQASKPDNGGGAT